MIEASDKTLIGLLNGSVPFRLLAHAGDRMLRAWPDSAGAGALARWRVLALDRRIRLTAVTLDAAILTHLLLTKFRAPEPVWGVRLGWAVIAASILLMGLTARPLAIAWTDWASRRLPRGRA